MMLLCMKVAKRIKHVSIDAVLKFCSKRKFFIFMDKKQRCYNRRFGCVKIGKA